MKARWSGLLFRPSGTGARPRWARLGAAALATLVLAVGVGVAADLLTGRSSHTTLHLQSISRAQLDQLGIKLVAATPPPYCALSDAVNNRGWAHHGLGGCPISRQAAEKDAITAGNATVLESALARATMPQYGSVGQDRLVWVVVVQNLGPRIAAVASCPVGAGSPVCFGRGLGGPRLVLLDGKTGAILFVTWAGGLRMGSMVPRPRPTGYPPVRTVPAGQTATS